MSVDEVVASDVPRGPCFRLRRCATNDGERRKLRFDLEP